MPMIYKKSIMSRFVIPSPTSSIRPLAKPKIYQFVVCFLDKWKLLRSVNTFWVVENNKPVTDAVNKLNKLRKANFISIFDFSTWYTKLSGNTIFMVLKNLIDFRFDRERDKCIIVRSYGARWVKKISIFLWGLISFIFRQSIFIFLWK